MACAGACRSFRAAKRATASTPGPRRALQPAPSPARRQPRDHATQASHLYAHPAALRMPSASICRSCSAARWPAVQPIPWTHHQSRAHQRAQQRQTRRSLRASVRPAPADTYTLRQGSQADLPVIAQAVLREMLNPLGLDPTRFTVATTQDSSGKEIVLGWGQLKPVDNTPQGGKVYELATLVTLEQHRGKGVGSAVVGALLARTSAADRVLLLTTTGTVGFYERLGFTVLPADARVPGTISLERTIGSFVAPLATGGQTLVVMEADTPPQQ